MPSTASLTPRRALSTGAALLAAALGVAACGSSSGAGDTDPAGFAPATSPIYVEAVVRPDDEQTADAQGALRKVLGTSDPGAKLSGLIDEAGRERGVTFARDIDPWLGDRVGAVMLSGGTGGGDGDGVVVAASSDDDKAGDALAKLLPKADERTHKDVDYRYTRADKAAGAVVGGALLIGTERGLKAAIDASKGDALADADSLEKARASIDDDRLGFVYMDTARLLRASLSSAGQGAQQSVAPFLGSIVQAIPKTVAVGLDADPEALQLDSAAIGGRQRGQAGDGSAALAALPGDAWLGFGIADLGSTVNETLDQIGSGGGLGGVGLETLLGQVEQTTGLDLRRDVLAWMGGAGIFVSGTSAADAGGGLVVTSKDAAATRRTITRLRALARQSGGSDVAALTATGVDEGFTLRTEGDGPDVFVALGGDRFVVAAGRKALTDALDSGGATLGQSPALRDAAAKLGDDVKPSFFLDMKRVTSLLAAEAGSDREFQKAKSYLDAFGAIAGGTSRDGDTTQGRAVATLP